MNTESNLALHVVIRKHEADGVIALILGDHARTEPYFTMPGPACKERCHDFTERMPFSIQSRSGLLHTSNVQQICHHPMHAFRLVTDRRC